MSWLPAMTESLINATHVISWADCPKCDGRGWFLINPFATGGPNGAGGLANKRQCQTCVAAYEKHLENQRLLRDPHHDQEI